MRHELKPILVYHYDGMGGAHDHFHLSAEYAKKAIDETKKQPPSITVFINLGKMTLLYDQALHAILATANGVPHPEEVAELAKVHEAMKKATEETNRISKAPLN